MSVQVALSRRTMLMSAERRQRLMKARDRVQAADREWFRQNPTKIVRVRRISRDELGVHTVLLGHGRQALSPRTQYWAIVLRWSIDLAVSRIVIADRRWASRAATPDLVRLWIDETLRLTIATRVVRKDLWEHRGVGSVRIALSLGEVWVLPQTNIGSMFKRFEGTLLVRQGTEVFAFPDSTPLINIGGVRF